jgi:plasmid stability protein
MSKMIQIRNVREEMHRALKARAALEGLSLSDYLVRELSRVLERPTASELVARLRRRRPVRLKTAAADIIRKERAAR